MSHNVADEFITQLKGLILNYLEAYPVKIYFFGSRATGDAGRYSDIDIAVLPNEDLPAHVLAELKDIIEESTIPYHVDIVNLLETDDKFKQKIIKEAVIWRD